MARPKGAKQLVSLKARSAAAEAGILPHEWLLKVSRGEPIPHKYYKIKVDKKGNATKELVEEDVYADFDMRVDAAKAVAQFYAPKLSTQTVSVPEPIQHQEVNKPLTDEELQKELERRGLPTTIFEDK